MRFSPDSVDPVNGPLASLGRGVASVLVLVGAAIAAVQAGPGPGAAPQTPVGATAVFEPKKLTVVVTAWWPWGDEPYDWSGKAWPWSGWPESSKTVTLRGRVTPDYEIAQTHLSSGEGGQLVAALKPPPTGTTSETRGQPATVRISGIARAGEYTGMLSLNPTDEKAAALDVTVKARHVLVWPLLFVYIGALIAWFGGRAYDRFRNRPAVKRVNLAPLDVLVYCGALMFGAVAFLLPIYTATSFGTWEQYLSVFVAGIIGKVVVDQAFAPLPEPPPAPAQVGQAQGNAT